jgi:hypothetical protein
MMQFVIGYGIVVFQQNIVLKMENQITEAFELGVKHASENAYQWLVNNLNKYTLVIDSKVMLVEDFKEQLYKAMIK